MFPDKIKSYFLIVLFFTAVVVFNACKNSKKEENHTTTIPSDTSAIAIAIAEVSDKILAKPGDDNLYHERALLYIKSQNFQYAMDDMSKALSIDSTKAPYFLTLSDLYFIANKTFNAKSALEKCLSIEPDNVKAHLKLAEIYFIVKKYDEANNNLEAVFKIEPFNTKAYFMKGMIYKETGDTAKAVSAFQTVIDKDQSEYNSYMQLGILYNAKNNALAEQYFTGALRLNPRSQEALYGRAMYLQEHNELDKAIQDYTTIIQINPQNKSAHFNLGYLHYTYLKVYDQAIKHYTDAITADPDYTEAYYNRGLSYEALGNIKAAKNDYEKALSLRPGYELAMLGMERLKK